MVYVIGIVAALIILFGFLCYKKAPPTEAIVVTGFGLSKPKWFAERVHLFCPFSNGLTD